MKKIAFFNHKGGVGKTTLTVNVADALEDLGKTVLLVDADPQCNLTAFYIAEPDLEGLFDDDGLGDRAGSLWSAIKPVVAGRGGVRKVLAWDVGSTDGGILLVPGDVMLSQYEEELPQAWLDSFARKMRGYDVMTAVAQVANNSAKEYKADVILYDVGPNVGALNRAVLLDCDYFITPVAADLFSLRALSTVGLSVGKWVGDWKTILSLATDADKKRLPKGIPNFLGYVTSAYKVKKGRSAASPHADWESKIAPRVRHQVVDALRAIDPKLASTGSNKLGAIKHFQSLPSEAQKHGVAIGKLHGHVNGGHNVTLDEARDEFAELAREIVRRTGI